MKLMLLCELLETVSYQFIFCTFES